MPLFEYQCENCGRVSELLMTIATDRPHCPHCDSLKLQKLISAHSSYSGTSQTRLPGAGDTGCCGSQPLQADCAGPVEIYLAVRDGRIQSVAYQTDRCMNTNACANTVAELIKGRDIETARKLTPEDVIAYLETLPVENFHYAELAVGALYRALRNYQDNQRSPWKKLYPRK